MTVQANFKQVVLIVLLVGLFFVPFSVTGLWWHEVVNCGHTLLFIPIFILLHAQLKKLKYYSNTVSVSLAALLLGLVVGVLVELLQGLMHRESSFGDLYKDFAGLMVGFLIVVANDQDYVRYRKILIVGAAGFLFLGAYSLFELGVHYVQRAKVFPVLVDFDASWAKVFTSFNNSELKGAPRVSHKHGLKLYDVQFNPGLYSGVRIKEPVADWSAYSQLYIDVWSYSDETASLVVRVHDKTHNLEHADRFNRLFVIKPGLNQLVIELNQVEDGPVKRKLYLTEVAGLNLFFINLPKQRVFGLSNFVLR